MKEPLFEPGRAITIIDAVFAFAMTLLVTTIDVPKTTEVFSNNQLSTALAQMAPIFFIYALSFVLLATFWMVHHKQSRNVVKVNSSYIWLNFLMLIFVVFLPFSTELVGDFGTYQIAAIVFEANLFMIGMSNYFLISYAYKKGLMQPQPDSEQMKINRRKNLVIPVISIIAIILTFFIPHWSTLVYLLIPLVFRLKQFKNSD